MPAGTSTECLTRAELHIQQLEALDEGQILPTNHPFNKAMLKLVAEMENFLPEVGRQMLDNVRAAFDRAEWR